MNEYHMNVQYNKLKQQHTYYVVTKHGHRQNSMEQAEPRKLEIGPLIPKCHAKQNS